MKDNTKNIKVSKKVGKGLLATITILVIIVIVLILSIGYLINKDKIEHELSVNRRINSIKELFSSTDDFNKDIGGITDIYTSSNGEEIELFPRDENSFNYTNSNYKIIFKEYNDNTAFLQYWVSHQILYKLSLIKQNPIEGNFLENPSNYKISDTTFFADYYNKYAELSGNLLIYPNGAYYSGEFNEYKQPNGFGEMHYFGTDTANNIKINDKITLELDDSFSCIRYYIGNFENGVFTGKGEYYDYYNGGYALTILKRNNIKGTPVGGYDTYKYRKINKNGGTYTESPEDYELIKESHIKDDGTSETIEKDLYGIEYKTKIDANGLESIEYNGKHLTPYTGGYDYYTSKLDKINPTISGNKLIWDELPGYKNNAEYIGDFYELSGKIIKHGEGILTINFKKEQGKYILSGLRDNNNFIEGVEDGSFYGYHFTNKGLFTGNMFSGTSLDAKFGIYTGTKDNDGGIFHGTGSYRIKDGTYYSGGFSDEKSGGYHGYGEFRFYIPIKSGGNFVDNGENYEMVYELTGYWNEGEYIGKNWYEV